MITGKCEAKHRPILIGESTEESLALVYVPRCKQWSCLYCQLVNKSQWAMRIYEGIEKYQGQGLIAWAFITLTSRPYLKTFEDTVAAWPTAWAKLSSRMRRKCPGMKYALLPERHKDGRLHVHMLVSHVFKKRWLKDAGFACGLGYMADSEPLSSSKKAAWYVSKYVGKSLGVDRWPPKMRRIRTSQKWPALEHKDDEYAMNFEWRIVRFQAEIEATEGIRQGLKFAGIETVKIIVK